MGVRFFPASLFCSVDLCVCFRARSKAFCFDYYSFLIYLKSATMVSNFVLFSQDHFESLVLCDLIKQNRPRRDGKSTQKNYTKKYLNDPDNHNGVVSHSEQDILECEVKWVLRSTAANKAIGGDGIPAKLFKILKEDANKGSIQYVIKFGKASIGVRTGRRAILKTVQATEQLQSSPVLVKLCSKSSRLGFSIMQT